MLQLILEFIRFMFFCSSGVSFVDCDNTTQMKPAYIEQHLDTCINQDHHSLARKILEVLDWNLVRRQSWSTESYSPRVHGIRPFLIWSCRRSRVAISIAPPASYTHCTDVPVLVSGCVSSLGRVKDINSWMIVGGQTFLHIFVAIASGKWGPRFVRRSLCIIHQRNWAK